MNKLHTLIIDYDKEFIEMIEKAIGRTENLIYAGSVANLSELSIISNQVIPSLILINIDLASVDIRDISESLRMQYPHAFIVLMNLDGKRFNIDKPDSSIADGYLEKDSLFQEIKKISIFLMNSYRSKDYFSLPDADTK
jgi:DNA-binding NarL/FixJ family response regulator